MKSTSLIIFTDFLGRLHPVIVHFPIGLLIGALLLEIWSRLKKGLQLDQGIRAMVYMGAFSALIAAGFGLLLRQTGNYDGDLIAFHQLAGLLTAGAACLTAVFYWKHQRLKNGLPATSLVLSCLLLGIAGHLGGVLTHGEGYFNLRADGPDYDAKQNQALLRQFSFAASRDSVPQHQLDQLNLQVRAIFAHNCYQCHSTEKRKGGLALDHKEGVFAGGDYGPVFTPGDPGKSELIRRLTIERAHEDAMPPKGKSLKIEEIELIRLWIRHGAHWADELLKVFREAPWALSKPPVPEAPATIRHPVDKFVNSYFEQQGLDWPAGIDDRRFIRRAYLDITGLLPSTADVRQFIADNRSNKRELLIDQLLADKQNYALHWLSFWNDLLRNDYSGTGFITGGRRQITDWLYKSLLNEKPYHHMVRELIDPTPEAEGFIRGIKWRGVVNASQRTELQAAQNISQSLLGINLKCASCHNSFVNNLTLDQAYGFANIFADSTLEINRCDRPTGRFAKTTFLYPELGEIDGDSVKARIEQLSEIIIQPENGRLYRTIVNRFWDRLLGRGIVAPVDEMDKLPWSQELLDWLAADFIDQGYDFRALLKTIMTSRTYQLPAVAYSSPNYLNSEKFVFRGPSARRLNAEQFVDALSQLITPFYHSVGYHPKEEKSEAKWIWYEEKEFDRTVLPKPGRRYFRKQFVVDKGTQIEQAIMLITADHSFECFLNGEKMASGSNWRKVIRVDLSRNLKAGKNLLAVQGDNEGDIPNPAGLLVSIRVRHSDGQEQNFVSDDSWKSTDSISSMGWMLQSYDDAGWETARQYGRFDNSYWGQLLDFRFEPDTTGLAFARASLVKQDPFLKALGRPVRENVTTKRSEEATLLQALLLTNGDFFNENVMAGAKRWLQRYGDQPEQLVDRLFEEALGRLPSGKEKRVILGTLGEQPDEEAIGDLIWSVVLLPEFQFI